MVANGLLDGNRTRQDIYHDLSNKLGTKVAPVDTIAPTTPPARRNSQAASSGEDFGSEVLLATSPHCSGQLQPPSSTLGGSQGSFQWNSEWHTSTNVETGVDHFATSDCESEPLSSPQSSATDSNKADGWTCVGLPVSTMRERFDALFSSDFLAFCLLPKTAFLEDFTRGTGPYCSRTLVYAVLALSTIVMGSPQQRPREGGECTLTPHWPDSQASFNEAASRTKERTERHSLPDIQALGMLSLYQARRGHDADALGLAETFAGAMEDLCLMEPAAVGQQDRHYARVRASTYCGAVSLVRYVHCLLLCRIDLL